MEREGRERARGKSVGNREGEKGEKNMCKYTHNIC